MLFHFLGFFLSLENYFCCSHQNQKTETGWNRFFQKGRKKSFQSRKLTMKNVSVSGLLQLICKLLFPARWLPAGWHSARKEIAPVMRSNPGGYSRFFQLIFYMVQSANLCHFYMSNRHFWTLLIPVISVQGWQHPLFRELKHNRRLGKVIFLIHNGVSFVQ